jgi:catechol 2,3-dioxygenase-like lactoylglutathione lyase family enzyme
MTEETTLQHVAVECSERETADRFFTTILGLPQLKSITLSEELSTSIFHIKKRVDMITYDNGKMRFEVFLTPTKKPSSFAHICIEVPDKNEFINRCRQHGLKPFFIEKDGKQLLFVRDFSENLYEVK